MKKKVRYFEVKIITKVECETSKEGEAQVREAFKKLMLKVHAIKCLQDRRSINQNSAMHLWFSQIASDAQNQGQTMDMLIKNPVELPITEGLLKDLFRLIGKTKYKKDSTAKLDKIEFNEVQKTFEKVVA
jgi:hypothetical protein